MEFSGPIEVPTSNIRLGLPKFVRHYFVHPKKFKIKHGLIKTLYVTFTYWSFYCYEFTV